MPGLVLFCFFLGSHDKLSVNTERGTKSTVAKRKETGLRRKKLCQKNDPRDKSRKGVISDQGAVGPLYGQPAAGMKKRTQSCYRTGGTTQKLFRSFKNLEAMRGGDKNHIGSAAGVVP